MSTAVKCKGCGSRRNREECRVTNDRQIRCMACLRDLEARKVRLTDFVPA
jgi:hypothetical protein